MASIEQEIQRRIAEGETGPVDFQWPDGYVRVGVVVECPHSGDSEHFALVPGSVFDEEVECDEGHRFFVTREDEGPVFHTERPEHFSPPVVVDERHVELGTYRSPQPSNHDAG